MRHPRLTALALCSIACLAACSRAPAPDVPAPHVAPAFLAVTPGAEPGPTAGLDAPAPGASTAFRNQPGTVVLTPAIADGALPPVTQAAARRAAPDGPRMAQGPIYEACRQAGRAAASTARCGCVQWVANQSLGPADQARGAGYFFALQELQDVRQSDNPAHERFWSAWTAFGDLASQQCRRT